MSGRHPWSEIKRRLTPEQCLRVAAKTAELRATLPPTTYAQVNWAAERFNSGRYGYNSYYRPVYDPTFRKSLLHSCSKSNTEVLVSFLNQWKSRRPAKLAGVLAESLPKVIHHITPLAELTLDAENLDDSTFALTEQAFDRLVSIQYVGVSTASRILGVLNPRLFVMWDRDIQKEYFNWQKRNGQAYVEFLKELRNSAALITEDARQIGITNPAELISNEIRQTPPFPLAKFINDYVWLTVTHQEKYPGYATYQEHHAYPVPTPRQTGPLPLC